MYFEYEYNTYEIMRAHIQQVYLGNARYTV